MASTQNSSYSQQLPPGIDPSSSAYQSQHYSRDSELFDDPEYSVPAQAQPVSIRSYAARAAARPDLYLDTSPPEQLAAQSPASQEPSYNVASTSATLPSRQDSVLERSPLQSLETRLGKEEKRARAEKAENVARQRSAKSRSTKQWPASANTPTSTQMSMQKPLPPSPGSPSAYDPARQRVRSYGYDSALTGGAAAAAVGAYQSARARPSDLANSTASHNTYDPISTNRSVSGPAAQTYSSSVPYASAAQPPAQQPQFQREVDAAFSTPPKQPASFAQTEPLPPENVQYRENSQGTQYSVPPQTDAGQRARKQVAFQAEDPNSIAAENRQGEDHHRFRDMFHRTQRYGRRYQGANYTHEWKGAETALLTAELLDLESAPADGRAWWERGGPVQPAERGDLSQPQSGFQPPLTLKCGPLLRYTGIIRDRETEKEHWRGSVMIVTQDNVSSYQTPPTLKLFHQPMDLVAAAGTANGPNGQRPASSTFDPVAGSPKVSRTGQTLYVKPLENIHAELDLSQMETDEGLFSRMPPVDKQNSAFSRIHTQDGEKLGKFTEVRAHRLHSERGLTFWRFNLQIELTSAQNRVAYRINRGTAMAFWVPAKGESMNVAFHSCNGFSLTVDTNEFSGPDPLWRDILNNHQIRPFHCMIGGGDQIYNDAAMKQTRHFQDWLAIQNSEEKHAADFSLEMQDELEQFYLDRYAMWFSQGLFDLANAQIPMINIWDDHDIIDGFGSYPHHFMSAPVFSGIGAVAFKYYMLFQHQSVPDENEETEPSWVLGAAPGPYINQLSRSIFVSLGKGISFVGLDCRTERRRDEVLSQETYDIVFDRCRREIELGQTRHLIVLLGVPIAYPRLNFLENVLTSRALDPIKALGRAGALSGFINKFDGGVEILDDLDDHWTAKHHKNERNWFIQELQELAAETSARITIFGGDVHLAAVGQFYSNPKLGIPKDQDHRYMPNVISSAIVNTPPPEMMADVLNKRNKVHHLDADTDEDMIPMFTHDVNGKPRNNRRLLPRRNWCSLREYEPGTTPPPTPPPEGEDERGRRRSFSLTRSLSFSRSRSRSRQDGEKRSLLRRFSSRKAPPSSYYAPEGTDGNPYSSSTLDPRVDGPMDSSNQSETSTDMDERGRDSMPRSFSFHRRPTNLSRRASLSDRSGRQGHIDLQGGLDIVLNCEIDKSDPAGFTTPYRIIVPALSYQGPQDPNTVKIQDGGRLGAFFGSFRGRSEKDNQPSEEYQTDMNGRQPTPPNDNGQPGYSTAATAGGAAAATAAVFGGTYAAQRSFGENGERGQSAQREIPPQPADARSQNQPQDPPLFGEIPNEHGSQSRYQTQNEQTVAKRPAPSSYSQPFSGPTSPTLSDPGYANSDAAQRSSSTRQVRPRAELPVRRFSASGPPPPNNIDQLPASVRKRYEMLNDPTTKEYAQQAEPPRRRYSQLNDPEAHKRFSQFEPLAGSRQLEPQQQQQPQPAPQPRMPPRPAPPPQAHDTHRRYSSAPMEMPLLPTNINQLRTSTHRTLQDTGAAWGETTQKRSVSAPGNRPANASASAAYHKAQLSAGEDSTRSLSNDKAPATSDAEATAPRPVSTAVAPPMVPLSRGQAWRANDIPAYPSPLASHSTQEPFATHDNQYQQSSGFAASQTRSLEPTEPQQPRTGSAPANQARSLGRQYSDEAYGYRGSMEGDRPTSGSMRDSWRRSNSGMPDKVARHFGGFERGPSNRDSAAFESEDDYENGVGRPPRRSFTEPFRQLSERAHARHRQRVMDRQDRREERARRRNSENRYSDAQYSDAGHNEQWYDAPENYDDYDDYDDEYEGDSRRRSWKFWQR